MKLRAPGQASLGRIACIAVLTALVVTGCGSQQDAETVSENATTGQHTARGKSLDPLHPVVEIDTSQGKIRVRLDAVNSPSTVRNFLNYAGQDFYTNTLFHYVDSNKIIVGGGYADDGQPKSAASTVRNEAHNGLKNIRGTIAMARDPSAGIDNATSQFYINLADSPSFDHRGEAAADYGYCVFGEVVAGLDVAEAISQLPTSDRGGDLTRTPTPPVIVRSINVVE